METTKRKRRKGLRLDDNIVERLPFKTRPYTVWDLTLENCGVRVALASKACVISVRVGKTKKFKTIGVVTADSPYEYLREQAARKIAELKRARLPRTYVYEDQETLRETIEGYIAANPDLSERTLADYHACIKRGFGPQMDQSTSRLTSDEIQRINEEHLAKLAAADPVNRPPKGFYAWQLTLRMLRAVLNWYAAKKKRPSPWPHRIALKLKTPKPRELPVELQGAVGRRRLIEGLKAMDTKTARACRFLMYTGFRRREGTRLTRANLLTENVLQFQSKTRVLRVPLSRQALELLDRDAEGSLLHVTEYQLRKPLIRLFGCRETPRGKRAAVTPHDLRRYFKSVGTELGIDPTILDLLVGHAIKGVNKSYIAKLRLGVLRAAAQKIADEIDNPSELDEEDSLVLGQVAA